LLVVPQFQDSRVSWWTLVLAPFLGTPLLLLAAELPGPNAPPDKSRYSLFSPTPPALMREFSTDRPDKTESAYTVDAGHYQLEMDLVNYAEDREGPVHAESFGFATMNLKAGLLNNLDLQLVLPVHNRERIVNRRANTVEKQSGFGDTTLRLKWNDWGNDGGPSALALMPFVTFPTHDANLGSRSVEGGFIIPLALELPREWSLGAMFETDWRRDSAGNSFHPELITSITLGHSIVGKLEGYAELFSQVSAEKGSGWVATADFGLVYQISKNLRLDAGINIGLTRAADDLNPFTGLSFRF
jgi:hypothetical protein